MQSKQYREAKAISGAEIATCYYCEKGKKDEKRREKTDNDHDTRDICSLRYVSLVVLCRFSLGKG